MVRLRPIAASDAPAVAAAVNDSRDALRRWMAWYRDAYDVDAAKAWIDDALASAGAGTGFQFAILDPDDNLIGIVGLEGLSAESGRVMIGYWITTHAVSRGIGRRAVGLAVEWARSRPDLRVVWAVAAHANLASRRVLEVNRFQLVGSRGVDERGDVALLYELELHAPGS